MNKVINILHLEDLPSDAGLIERILRKGNFEFDLRLVETREGFEAALDSLVPDIVLSDHSLPSFDSFGALSILKERKLNIPFILITATISEEFAVDVMKHGADDYILKDRLERLPSAVLQAIDKKQLEVMHQKSLEEIIANEALLKETEHLANIGSFKINLLNNTEQWSEQLYEILDYSPTETEPSLIHLLNRVHKKDFERVRDAFGNIMKSPAAIQLDYKIVNESRTRIKYIHSELWVRSNEKKEAVMITGFIQDVTATKKAEEKIIKAHRLYAFISQVNQSIIHAVDERTVFREVCSIAVTTGKFGMAWVGEVNLERKKINLIEECGAKEGDVERFTDVSYENNGPKEYVVKVGSYYVCNDIERDPMMANSRSFASARGFGSCIMLPMKKNDTLYGIFSLYSGETNFFDFEEIKLLEEVLGNISFALDGFEKEKQRQEAVEKLANSEAILKEAQTIAHIGNWQLNLITGECIWSEETCKIYGLPISENIQNYESWLSFIHPEDLEEVKELAQQAMEKSRNFSFFHRILRRDNTLRYLQTQGQFRYLKGKAVTLNGVAHDITEEKIAELAQRKNEIYLQGILDSTDNGILAVDNDNNLINVNNRFIEMWSIPPEMLNGKGDVLAYVNSQLDGSEGIISGESSLNSSAGPGSDILQLKDGRVYERFANPLILNNEFVGRVWSFKDISERRKHIQEIEDRNTRLNEIAWIQSHVVRAPLSRIMGLIEMTKKNYEAGAIKPELLNHLFNSAIELDDIIRSIVDKTETVFNVKHPEEDPPASAVNNVVD